MLRPYQEDLYHQIVNLIRKGRRRILVVSVTGSGKTVLASHILKQAFTKGNAAMFNCHRAELVRQSADTFYSADIPFGVISPQYPQEYKKIIQVSSIQTLARRLTQLNHRPKVFIWDECHHLPAANWSAIFHNFPEAVHIGLTATPERLDGRGLGDYFEEMILGPSMADLMFEGYLTKYRLKATPNKVSVDGIHKRMGDYISTDLAALMNTPVIRGDTIQQWIKHAQGLKTIGFAVNVNHSKELTEDFVKRGFSAEHIDGGNDKGFRSQAIGRYKDGHTELLFNVDLFGEGFDVPATQAIIQNRKTESLSLHLQQIGRVLRPIYHPRFSKDELKDRSNRILAIEESVKPYGIIIDQVDNYVRHGFADDEREWSLQGRKKKSDERSILAKECPKCYNVDKGLVRKCSICGFEYIVVAPKYGEITNSNEELVDIDVEAIRKENKKKQFLAKTKEELVELALKRGSNKFNANKWAQYVLAGREKAEKNRKANGN